MSIVIDENSESGFVFSSVIEFMKCWETGANSRLVLETFNGNAWVNLSCCLGRPWVSHVVPGRKKSKKREEKDNLRAAAYQQKVSTDESSEKVEADVENKDSVEDTTTTVAGFADFSVEVTTSEIDATDENVIEVSKAVEFVIRKFMSDNYKDVEVTEIDFKKRCCLRPPSMCNTGTNKADFVYRLFFRQKGDEKELDESDFSKEIASLIRKREGVRIPLEKRFTKTKNMDFRLEKAIFTSLQ